MEGGQWKIGDKGDLERDDGRWIIEEEVEVEDGKWGMEDEVEDDQEPNAMGRRERERKRERESGVIGDR